MATYLLGPILRAQVRSRLFRRPAFNVPLYSRQLIRKLSAYISGIFPGAIDDLRILPISSVEWTSEMWNLGTATIIIFDTEQNNALEFISLREFGSERPLFHYNEYAIRIAELLLGLGNTDAALRMSQVNHARLVEYSNRHDVFPHLPRPINIAGLTEFSTLHNLITPSFLLGHETGHFLKKHEIGPIQAFATIQKLWHNSEYQESDSGMWERFILPSIIQRFDSNGRPAGNLVRSSPSIPYMSQLRSKMVEESQADYIGILMASQTAKEFSIEPTTTFRKLLMTLEGLERHLILRRLTERLPSQARQSSVELEGSTLESRVFMMGRMLAAIVEGELECPQDIRDYWHSTPIEFRKTLASEECLDRLAVPFSRSNTVARGAIYLGSGGTFPSNLPSWEQLKSQHGQFAGNQEALYLPFRLPSSIYDLGEHFEWASSNDGDPGMIGFSCAVRDLTEVLMHPESIDEQYGTHYLREGDKLGGDILGLLRHPRTCVVQRYLGK